jgi:hypothetical protein
MRTLSVGACAAMLLSGCMAPSAYNDKPTSTGPAEPSTMAPASISRPTAPTTGATKTSMLPQNNSMPSRGNASDYGVSIYNSGKQQLALSFWNPEGAWQPVSIVPSRTTKIMCEPCGREIVVSFHDGVETKQFTTSVGLSYYISWSDDSNRWTLWQNPR